MIFILLFSPPRDIQISFLIFSLFRFVLTSVDDQLAPLLLSQSITVFLTNSTLIATLMKREFEILLYLDEPALKISDLVLELIVGLTRLCKRTRSCIDVDCTDVLVVFEELLGTRKNLFS